MTTNKNSPKHITLISQGGISLGAFMAGVFFEIIKDALEEKPHFVIDIIAGASAGAMTATIATYYLLQGTRDDFKDPENNALYQAWVEKADMESIDPIIDKTQRIPIEEFEVFKKKEDRKSLSLLSGYAIEDITRLIAKPPEIIKKPIALLMTVTNLQGLIIQSPSDRSNKSISNAEYRQFLFYPELENKPNFPNMWKKAIDSGRASGAFPVAFPPIPDASSLGSINLEYLSDDYFTGEDPTTRIFNPALPIIKNNQINLSYSDGGILDNLPILKGVNFEASITNISNSKIKEKFYMPRVENDENYLEFCKSLLKEYPQIGADDNRLNVYVQTNPVSDLRSPERLTKKYFTILEMVMSGLLLPHDEHEATQLRQIIEIEEKVKLKKQVLENINDSEIEQKLDEAIPYNSISLSPISPLVINKIKEAIDSQEDIDINIRLRSLVPIYQALRQKENIRQGLDVKDPSKLLVSDFINAFGGFFDRRYREHDFLLGRICGVTWLSANFEIQYSQEYIQQLAGEINSKILSENPSIENLSWSSRARLFRIVLRFIRIAILESKSDKIKNIWDILYLPLALSAAILLRLIDFATTIFLLIADRLEKLL